uniref:Uncharacterized protein n=1 Tax=Rhizophora mucronata TaxID=61149 RepID=A0A2P2NAU5_RHIMU
MPQSPVLGLLSPSAQTPLMLLQVNLLEHIQQSLKSTKLYPYLLLYQIPFGHHSHN